MLDLHLAQEAERLGKLTGAVERVEEQCLPLNGLSFSQVWTFLKLEVLQTYHLYVLLITVFLILCDLIFVLKLSSKFYRATY